MSTDNSQDEIVCQAEVWGDGKPSRQCSNTAIPRLWVDSYKSVFLCRTHERAADKGRGVWVLLDDGQTVGTFFKQGMLMHFRPGFPDALSGVSETHRTTEGK